MAILTAAIDETGTHDGKGNFYFGGFVAPAADWHEHFNPAWQERVLSGSPPIPYLHMADIRSRAWRARHGLTEYEGDRRVDEGCRVINSMGSLFLVTARINEGHFKHLFGENADRDSRTWRARMG